MATDTESSALARPRRRVTTKRIIAFSTGERVPPAEIQLWNVGDNPTDFGVHRWTQRSIQEAYGRYLARGNRILIDVEHNGAKVETNSEPAITGGYASLEIRAGAPWLVFEWSDYAKVQIATGQRRYLSPEYDIDKETGEITAIYCVSLVANPATWRARVLASAEQKRNMDPTLAAIMALLGSVEDPTSAIAAIKSLVATLSDGAANEAPAEPGDPAALAAAPPPAGDAPGKMAASAPKVKASSPNDPPVNPPQPAPASPAAPVPPPAPTVPDLPANPQPPPAPAAVDPRIRAATDSAVASIEASHRDLLIRTEGHRLVPSIRQWASSQPLAVVQGLIAAAPADGAAGTVRASATRGDTQGSAPLRGLQGAALDELRSGMGLVKASSVGPRREGNKLFLPATTPSELRAMAAAKAAKGGV